jgi:dGTPase
MDWDKLLTTERLGSRGKKPLSATSVRPEFQKDYDRIIFSSPFRRLQNKTQVFPLPGSIFVHNRLTHSLEVASIGKTLGDIVALELTKARKTNTELIYELGTIVSAACLAHDLGNPPFGHSGESAISRYFQSGEGVNYKNMMEEQQWYDLLNFEGNANAFRILAHSFKGRRKGGFALTYSTLAALVKYPFPSSANIKKKKYGFFHSEKELFHNIASKLNIPLLDEDKMIFARYPLVFLVEAADDIAYQLMDLEDAHKLKIIETTQTEKLFLDFFDQNTEQWLFEMKESVYTDVTDTNERIAFLRSMVINKLIKEVSSIFIKNIDNILKGTFKEGLIKHLDKRCDEAMRNVRNLSVNKIYKHPEVVTVELAGYNILGTLLEEFIPAVLKPDNDYHKKLLSLIPEQYMTDKTNIYNKIQTVLDFVSNMTDLYAVKLYKDIKGISIL